MRHVISLLVSYESSEPAVASRLAAVLREFASELEKDEGARRWRAFTSKLDCGAEVMLARATETKL